jgi:hypothetical protein
MAAILLPSNIALDDKTIHKPTTASSEEFTFLILRGLARGALEPYFPFCPWGADREIPSLAMVSWAAMMFSAMEIRVTRFAVA